MKNPTHARTKMPVSSGVLWLLATLTLRLRWPCGARMAIITTVAASTTAFAIHGFMANHLSLSSSRLRCRQGVCPANGLGVQPGRDERFLRAEDTRRGFAAERA